MYMHISCLFLCFFARSVGGDIRVEFSFFFDWFPVPLSIL